ncbi:MAG: hypothetical protein LBF55_07540 [Prevotellaceae bacterium]|jgi:hypothetical protein|nr:hypothetical protein [Prevotellaceae bacterium]
MIQVEPYQLRSMVHISAELGALRALRAISSGEANVAEDRLSQAQACKLFGFQRVKRWRDDGAVGHYRSGAGKNSKIYYYRSELRAQELAESRELSDALSLSHAPSGDTQQSRAQQRISRYEQQLRAALDAEQVMVTEARKFHDEKGRLRYHVSAAIDGEQLTALSGSFEEALSELVEAFKSAARRRAGAPPAKMQSEIAP